MKKQEKKIIKRQPVIVVMGHIDHGKSTLLDYIRKSNVALKEAGGITQHIGAYEVTHTDKEGVVHEITFIDTPGHAAFSGIRNRGAEVADIAILVVSAEDGVKPQTVEALGSIKKSGIPFIVAINKIDKPEANIERTKQSLLENEIYIEGYGGTVSCVPVSAKTGEGVSELLDIITLTSDLEEISGDVEKSAEGIIIETNLDNKAGLTATVIVKDGTLRVGQTIVSSGSYSSVRSLENFLGKKVSEIICGKPARIIGWNTIPPVGEMFITVASKRKAEENISVWQDAKRKNNNKKDIPRESTTDIMVIPMVVKADTAGSLEAILGELKKIGNEKIKLKIIHSGIGTINESDIKAASGTKDTVVLGFNIKTDFQAKAAAERMTIQIETFTIIYKLVEWLNELLTLRTPKTEVEEATGTAKILKIFSRNKDKQIIGGKVEEGILPAGANVKILRRESEIGRGKVRNLQQQKQKASEISKGTEFGALVEAKIEIAPGDRIVAFVTVVK